ncbi:MAG: AraC family transcriptional regulator [Gammaproteobacteria bacterium]|nr:AraC family transcriptional regulator [Gammaproteobacteria bacterium]
MRCRYEEQLFHDIDQFRAHMWRLDIEPLQLSRGRLELGFATLAFEDLAITRLDCNRKVSDRLHMDPSWLLLVVQLAPQRWGAQVAPAESLTVIAPDTEYRTGVPDGFRCAEAAIRLDLADELGLGRLSQLKGAEAIIPISAAAARSAEHRANQLLGVSASNGLAVIGGETAQALRDGCLDFLCFLRGVAFSTTRGRASFASTEGKHRFTLVEDALQIIETAPVEQPPSVAILATTLNTTRRTLLNAFQETLGTSPSRYMLARRLNGVQRDLHCGKSPTVTDAALDYGFEHFGRFAYHYRTLFGEMPSATLKRASMIRRDVLG